jgi:DNA-binding NtrC family response regulator
MIPHLSVSNKKILLNVLLIDDEIPILNLNECILENDFKIYKAQNITAAIEVLEKQDIHIIVSDHHIGIENGLNFLIKLKETHPEIIKILFTSCVSQEVVLQSHNSQEVFKYLTKPCPNDKLLESLKLAEIAYHVLLLEIKIKEEHGEMKELIGEVSAFRFKVNNTISSCRQLYLSVTQNLVYLGLAILIGGLCLILFLYSLKSIVGIDIFK